VTSAAAAAGRWVSRCALVGLSCSLFGGCYEGKVLVAQARSAALNTRLAEVDLGTFHTTLPRDKNSISLTEMRLHIFGTVPRYRVPAIEKQLKTEAYRLRHETLVAVRRSTPEELADPNLTRLRQRIEQIVNGILEEGPVKTIGFYDFALRRM
jgi:hypothetical protein